MIRRNLARFGALAVIVGLMGCYAAPVIPPGGNVYSNISAPLDVDADGLGTGSKSGSSAVTSILGVVSWGDCSVEAAAGAGGISTVNQLDYEFFNILGIYQKFTTVAHGD